MSRLKAGEHKPEIDDQSADTERLSVAFQGARGSFSHRAGQLLSRKLKGDEPDFIHCRSFEEVFRKVVDEQSAFGVVPLENSSVGSIVATYDLLSRNDVYVVAEVYVPVHHQLIGFADSKLDALRQVYSHPVALDQCRQFIASLPNVETIAHWDTGGAAFFVKDEGDRTKAAIASEFAAKETGLAILSSNIEDFEENRTRFGVIALNEDLLERLSSVKTTGGRYKMACVAELDHKPGTLARLLIALSDAGTNLTKIESRPIPENPWHYKFFLDMEVPSRDGCADAKEVLERRSRHHKVLGCYSIAQAVIE